MADLAFRTMTHHRLGQKDEAQAVLARLRQAADAPHYAQDAGVRALVREAEDVLGGRELDPSR